MTVNGTDNWIYTIFTEDLNIISQPGRPPPWSSDRSSWLQIYRSGFSSQRNQIFWVVGLVWGPLSLVSTTEELFGRKSSGSSLENQEYGRRDPSRWLRGTLYSEELALTSLISGSRSVSLVRSQTQAMEFLFITTRPGWKRENPYICWELNPDCSVHTLAHNLRVLRNLILSPPFISGQYLPFLKIKQLLILRILHCN
jgi:hypothetical protein